MSEDGRTRAEIHAIWMNGLTFALFCICLTIVMVTCMTAATRRSHDPPQPENAKPEK